ncbi:MAG: helix-turn-helix domain-containing protein [Prevotella sp.]
MAVFIAIFLVMSCGNTEGKENNAATKSDKVKEENQMAAYINKICRTKPDEALHMLDQAEMSHKMRTVKVNLLRAMTYVDGYYDLDKGLEYAMKAYNDPTIKNDTLPKITITRMLTALNYALSRFSQACSMATEGSALAYAVGDKEAIAYFYQYIAFTKYELGDHEEAYHYFERSINLYKQLTEEQPHWVYVSDMFAVQLKEIQYLNDEGRHREALAKTRDCEATLKRLTIFPDLADGLHDKLTAQYLSVACCVFYNSGNKANAEEGYRRMMATDYVKSDLGQNAPAIYQVLSGRYHEALERTQKEDASYKGKDTVNTLFIDEVLNNGLAASQRLGYHNRANSYFNRILSLKDSINLRNQRQTAMELAEIYESRDKDIQLVEKDAVIERNRLFLVMAAIIIALALAAIVLIIRYNRIIQRKNKAVVRNIEEKLQLMQIAGMGRADNKDDSADRELFERIDSAIREKQLYLQPDFTRDTLCQMLNINRTQCSSVIKVYANCSFPTYVNRLRLNHAIELMKLYPQYSIEAIANDCGMERANFHRRFVEEFGITPSEFKKTKL